MLMSLQAKWSFIWLMVVASFATAALRLLGQQAGNPQQNKPARSAANDEQPLSARYEALRLQYQDLTYSELCKRLGPSPELQKSIPFDPQAARYFDLINFRLGLTEIERSLLRQNGFVSIDQGCGLSFPAAYQQIYTSDLPVLVTTDSVLHALHRSYDEILKELENSYFRATLDQVLADCQSALAQRAKASPATLAENLQDVDLFLGVARKLLTTPVAPPKAPRGRDGEFPLFEERNAPVPTGPSSYSKLGQDAVINAIEAKIAAMGANGGVHESISLYGAERSIDFTQFRPRGHYTESAALGAYFRCAMWLGRADCGFYVTQADAVQVSVLQSQRELRSAVLLTELLEEAKAEQRLAEMDQALQVLVGNSDNFGVPQLIRVLGESQIQSVQDLVKTEAAERLQIVIAADPKNSQLIRSQKVIPEIGEKPTPIPIVFQVLGQRFIIDSFALSKVVHDDILFEGKKILRHRPLGMDVMAILGNREATTLLEQELETWKYGANFLACQQIVQQTNSEFWSSSIHHAWLDSLRSLHSDLTKETHAPAATKTVAWQRKQLQTQLASWAELRRDNILYAKQSFGVPGCSFPCGYVEPYPEFYAKLRGIAESAARVLKSLSIKPPSEERKADLERNRARQVAFFEEMSRTMMQLEQISRHELKGLRLTEAEQDFLRSAFDDSARMKFGSSSKKDFSGWYCKLFYERHQSALDWEPLVSKPIVADVHTNVDGNEVLEVATGDVRLMVLAVEGEQESTLFVGPVFSYYEFWQPAQQRLTDQAWRERLRTEPPGAPDWTTLFAAPLASRPTENPEVTAKRRGDSFLVTISERTPENYGSTKFDELSVSEEGMRAIARLKNVHELDLSETNADDRMILALEGLTDLRSLNLRKTLISDKCIAHLEQHRRLQFLDLSKTMITDAAIPALVKLSHLSQIELQETKISIEGIRELKGKLSHARINSR